MSINCHFPVDTGRGLRYPLIMMTNTKKAAGGPSRNRANGRYSWSLTPAQRRALLIANQPDYRLHMLTGDEVRDLAKNGWYDEFGLTAPGRALAEQLSKEGK